MEEQRTSHVLLGEWWISGWPSVKGQWISQLWLVEQWISGYPSVEVR